MRERDFLTVSIHRGQEEIIFLNVEYLKLIYKMTSGYHTFGFTTAVLGFGIKTAKNENELHLVII